jgi:hypothetical protein
MQGRAKPGGPSRALSFWLWAGNSQQNSDRRAQNGQLSPFCVVAETWPPRKAPYSAGNHAGCVVVDGAMRAAVSDGALGSAGAKLRLEFEPPITAFHTFCGSLDIADTVHCGCSTTINRSACSPRCEPARHQRHSVGCHLY